MSNHWRMLRTFAATLCAGTLLHAAPGGDRGLTVIALGDAGENNGVLRGCATYVANMSSGQHDAGKFDMLLFLGDTFGPTGLNIPVGDVQKHTEAILESFRGPMEDLGRGRVHALAGEHDYYARNAIDESRLLGLIRIEEAPIGLTDRGNAREAAIPGWTYHYGVPADAVLPVAPGSADSAQFIFFDTALPLRTPSAAWTPALDGLRSILRRDRSRPHILWRIFCSHHPFACAGEHAGYTAWDDESGVVEYVTPCDRDSNALGWVRNTLDPEDLCAPRYRDLLDSLRQAIRACGVKIQLALSSHDHSLQLLSLPSAPGGGEADPVPSVQVVSGAASTPARVRFPAPPSVFTSAGTDPSQQGESLPGFARLTFTAETCAVVFYNGNNGDPLDMGGGRKEFRIGRDGVLILR